MPYADCWHPSQIIEPKIRSLTRRGSGVLGKFALYWIIPESITEVVGNYFRLLGDHFAVRGSPDGESSRCILASPVVAAFWWPHHVNYHVEHHWYPSVPFYNLPQLHKTLVEIPEARRSMNITRGWMALWRQLTTQHAAP